jgi:hypothetical protein
LFQKSLKNQPPIVSGFSEVGLGIIPIPCQAVHPYTHEWCSIKTPQGTTSVEGTTSVDPDKDEQGHLRMQDGRGVVLPRQGFEAV